MTPPLANNITTDSHELVEQLSQFASFDDLRRSAFYRDHQSEISALLDEPRVHEFPDAQPRLRSFLRVVEWNIERGSRLEGVIEALTTHHVLKFADLLLLNELDDGMNRSGNLNIPFELSRALEAHVVFGVEYLELTKGAGDEVMIPGENTTALHGNAILTRHTYSHPQVIRLPRCENNFESKEQRIGGRIGILLDIEIGGTRLVAGNTHLDVVNTPRCRANQMRSLLRAVNDRLETDSNGRAIVGGDLNSHTFARGNRLRAMKNTATILTSSGDSLRQRLSHPERREGAIREFGKFGYQTEGFNDRKATSRSIVSNLDDPARLPRPIKWWINRRIPRDGLLLEFRLDWLAARGLRALMAGEAIDAQTGVASVGAQTFQGLTHNGTALSDHDPIVVDVSLGP